MQAEFSGWYRQFFWKRGVKISEHPYRESASAQTAGETADFDPQALLAGAMLSSSTEHIYLLDRHGRFLFASASSDLWGMTPSEIVGKSWRELGLPAFVIGPFMTRVQSVFEMGRPLSGSLTVRAEDGLHLYDYTLTPSRDDQGLIEAVACLVRDVTRRASDDSPAEDRFHHLIEANVIGMLVVRDGMLVDASDTVLHMIGCSRQALRDGTVRWDDLTPPEYADLDRQQFDEVLAAGRCVPYEKEYLHQDGHRVPVLIGTVLLGHIPLEWVSFVVDLSEQKRAEQELHRSEAQYRSLFETLTQGVVYHDAFGQIVSANPAALQILGLSIEQLQVSPPDFPVGEALRTGQPVRDVVLSLTHVPSGEQRWLLVSSVPQFRPDETQPSQVHSVFSDITHQKSAEEALHRAMSQQRAFLRDVLSSVTEGRLILCADAADLPALSTHTAGPFALTREGGLKILRESVRAAAAQSGHAEPRVEEMMTAVSEAGMNAIVHANGGEATVFRNETGLVQTQVIDRGHGIPLKNLPHATLQKGFTTAGTLGHGMKMMLQSCDRVYLLTGPSGTVVVLEQEREPPTPFA